MTAHALVEISGLWIEMGSAGEVAGKVIFCLCGPVGSLCCFILSIWGIIMLSILGVFYYVEATVLLEDFHDALPHVHGYMHNVQYYESSKVTAAYHTAAYSCWGAAVIYVLFLALSGSFIGVNIWRKKKQAT